MPQPNTKRNAIMFWVFTILFCAFMMMSTVPNILSTPEWVDVFNMLGYPLYMLPFIGVAKLLGIIALLVPGFPRIKECRYVFRFKRGCVFRADDRWIPSANVDYAGTLCAGRTIVCVPPQTVGGNKIN